MRKNILIFIIIIIIILISFFVFKNYKNYKKQPLIKDLFYLTNFVDISDFNHLKQALDRYNQNLEQSRESLSNVNRYNFKLPPDSKLNVILDNMIKQIREKTGLKNLRLLRDTGIEYRKYEPGSFMDWHQDIILTNPPQWECVFTLRNNSDSVTEFQDPLSKSIEKIKSEENSLIMLRAGGIPHQVTLTTKGERYFLKFALSEVSNNFEEKVYPL